MRPLTAVAIADIGPWCIWCDPTTGDLWAERAHVWPPLATIDPKGS